MNNSAIERQAGAARRDEEARTALLLAEELRKASSVAGDDSWASPKLQLDQWHKSEGVAMHFNDLLMRFRLQALGGLSVVVGIAGVASRDSVDGIKHALPYLIGFVFTAWTGLWVLDTCYYSGLLRGAVNEVLALEKRSPLLNLSTAIHAEVSTKRARFAAHVFYGLISTVLFAIGICAWRSAH